MEGSIFLPFKLIKLPSREFPGGPVVSTLCFHCREPKLDPWSGNKDPSNCLGSWTFPPSWKPAVQHLTSVLTLPSNSGSHLPLSPSLFLFKMCLFFNDCATQHVRSYLPDQGSNPGFLQGGRGMSLNHRTTREIPASLFNESCDYTEPTRKIQDNLPSLILNLITSTKSFSIIRKYSWDQDIYLRATIQPTMLLLRTTHFESNTTYVLRPKSL